MNERPAHREKWRVSAVVLMVLSLLTGTLTAADRSEPGKAAFTDAEHAQGQFATISVAPVVAREVNGQTCRILGLLGLNLRVEVYWRFPPEYDSYSASDVQYGRVEDGVMQVVTSGVATSGDQAGGWTTTYFEGLLGGLFGGSRVLGIRVVDPSGWVSPWVRVTASAGIGGVNRQCSTSTDAEPIG